MQSKKNQHNKINTLVLGLEHFIDKIGYQAKIYKENNISVKYLTQNKNGNSEYFAKKYNANVTLLKGNALNNIIKTYHELKTETPEYVELYITGKSTTIYGLLCFIFKVKLILILRGGELQQHKGNKISLGYINFLFLTSISHRVIIKEKNITNEYKKNNYNTKKIREIGNSIPTPIHFEKKSIDLLFLNSIRKERNIIFTILLIKKLLDTGRNLKIVLAGFNSIDDPSKSFDLEEENKALALIKKLGIENKIEIHGFVKNPSEFHSKSKIFLFPAETVFANYSLLESMSYGAVPIVYPGEGAELIVNENNGYILPLSIDLWEEKIMGIINNEKEFIKKSQSAIETIRNKFSIENWFVKMMESRK